MNIPLWRQKTWKEKLEREKDELKKQGKEPKERQARVSDASIRSEMEVFRSIMAPRPAKSTSPILPAFKGKLPLDKVRREEFTPEEYRKLHTFARGWVKKALRTVHTWYRTVAYNFILIMCNTGMRPTEAKNLRWRDMAINEDGQGRKFVVLQCARQGQVPQTGRRQQRRRLPRTHPRHHQGNRAGRFRIHDCEGQAGRPALSLAHRQSAEEVRPPSVHPAAAEPPIASGTPTPRSACRRAWTCISWPSRWARR